MNSVNENYWEIVSSPPSLQFSIERGCPYVGSILSMSLPADIAPWITYTFWRGTYTRQMLKHQITQICEQSESLVTGIVVHARQYLVIIREESSCILALRIPAKENGFTNHIEPEDSIWWHELVRVWFPWQPCLVNRFDHTSAEAVIDC